VLSDSATVLRCSYFSVKAAALNFEGRADTRVLSIGRNVRAASIACGSRLRLDSCCFAIVRREFYDARPALGSMNGFHSAARYALTKVDLTWEPAEA